VLQEVDLDADSHVMPGRDDACAAGQAGRPCEGQELLGVRGDGGAGFGAGGGSGGPGGLGGGGGRGRLGGLGGGCRTQGRADGQAQSAVRPAGAVRAGAVVCDRGVEGRIAPGGIAGGIRHDASWPRPADVVVIMLSPPPFHARTAVRSGRETARGTTRAARSARPLHHETAAPGERSPSPLSLTLPLTPNRRTRPFGSSTSRSGTATSRRWPT